jgi:MFS family permease
MTDSTQREPLQKSTLRTLAIAQILSGVGFASTVAAGSLLVAQITGSETLAGLAQTSAVLGAAALALPLASITRRGGRRHALSIGYLLGAIGAVLAVVGGATSFVAAMLAGQFLLGAASASGYQARFAAVDLAHESSRARDLSFVVWASTIGAVLGPNLMAPFGAVAKVLGLPSLTGPYVLAALMFLVGATVIFTQLVPDPFLTAQARLHQEQGFKPAHLKARAILAIIVRTPKAALGLSATSIGHVAMVSIMVMTPVHMKHVDVSVQIIGLVISVHIAGMYAFSPLVGRLADTIGRIRVISLGAVVLLASAIIAGTAAPDDSLQLGIGLFLLGLGWSGTLVAGSTLLSESINPDHKASAQGASDLVMNASGALGGALAGVIIASLSYGWLCAIASIPVAIMLLWSLRLARSN